MYLLASGSHDLTVLGMMFTKGRRDDLCQTGDGIGYLGSSLKILHGPLSSPTLNLGSEALCRHVDIG